MKINHSTPPVTSSANRVVSARSEASRETAAVNTPELQSSGLGRTLAQSSDVDMAKVNEIRQAISEGQLDLDPQVLAAAVMDLHRS